MMSLQDPLEPIDFNASHHRSPASQSATTTLISPSKENISPQLDVLSKLNDLPVSLQAPSAVKQALDIVVSYFTSMGNVGLPIWSQAGLHLHPATPPNTNPLPIIPSDTIVRHNIQINRHTTLETVYYYTLTPSWSIRKLVRMVLWAMCSAWILTNGLTLCRTSHTL